MKVKVWKYESKSMQVLKGKYKSENMKEKYESESQSMKVNVWK